MDGELLKNSKNGSDGKLLPFKIGRPRKVKVQVLVAGMYFYVNLTFRNCKIDVI